MKTDSKLSKYKMKYEDKKGKLKLSPTAGKPKPLVVRATIATKKAVSSFIAETFNAIKIILRGIL